ncbi:unnamed protein product [Acanthoscelides obtectus]|uniref:Protein CNPPD1 n=1 Tax=Acanthoscelides obtectus TaxID=200917 RepID=A0A9P0JWP6_ACAOB|nr:unnamed protein product [Acanthoscelides obtectus]CAK1625453.1 Protein CNPPD1 [Acanthoscelides obtectus]
MMHNLKYSQPKTYYKKQLAAELFSEAQKGKSLERLHCHDAAKISRNACVSPCSLVLAILYLERLKACNPEYLDRTAPSDLFLISLMVSSKFLFDDGETDEVIEREWAASGGVTLKYLLKLEKDFLNAIDWEVYVSELNFWRKLTDLETQLAEKQGAIRGHFTYTELEHLAGTIEIHKLLNCLVTFSVIMAATYTAGLLTIVGSVFLAGQIPGTSLYGRKTAEMHNGTLETAASVNINCTFMERMDTIVAQNSTQDAQTVTWDYWNIPIMDWLAKSSKMTVHFPEEITIELFPIYLETSVTNLKRIELEDQIHKATKTRIQDQMESSWHKEWTSTIKFLGGAVFEKMLPYVLYMKY